jgi:ATP-binding cassette subfamily F protein 3
MLQLQNVSKAFTSNPLLTNVTLEIKPASRIGLVGRNGAGKSTLLKLLMGQIEPDEGNITYPSHVKVNYLSQEPNLNPHNTLEQEMRSVFAHIDQLNARESDLLAQMASPDLSAQELTRLVDQLGDVQQALANADTDTLDARITRILQGLGFADSDAQRMTTEFSGGWQMRINLAKVLLEGADILLLDEPTNHLDMETCEWLEQFLVGFTGGIVLVSHDRQFLDAVTNTIAEVDRGTVVLWPGNYTAYLAQKAEKLERDTAAYDRQQKQLDKQQAFVDRFRASATRSTQAKSRERQLDKIVRLEPPTEDNRLMRLQFPVKQASGIEVMTIKDLAKGYTNKPLFAHVDAVVERGQRIFLLGANGAGKTTMLRLLLGLEPPDQGTVTLGHNVELGYFSQQQLETLNPDQSPLETMRDECPKLNDTELRNLLGRFLLRGDDVFKPVGVLSGGEKSKLALAKLMMSGTNTLILDEPTNHMDLPAKEVITEALAAYEGTFLCISHDRTFIDALATQLWELVDGHLIVYEGNYAFYKQHRVARRELAKQLEAKRQAKRDKAAQAVASPVATPKGMEVSPAKASLKHLQKLEKQVLSLETEVATLQTRMAEPTLQSDYAQLAELTQQLTQKQAQLAEATQAWEAVAEACNV